MVVSGSSTNSMTREIWLHDYIFVILGEYYNRSAAISIRLWRSFVGMSRVVGSRAAAGVARRDSSCADRKIMQTAIEIT